MSQKSKPKRPINPRRTFSIKGQLVAKHGEEIVEAIHALAVERPKRKRRRRKKPVTA